MSTGTLSAGQLCAFAATIATALLVGNTAAAQTATACVGPQGQMRIVTSAGECRPSESAINWNLQGPKGDQGDPGVKGDPGDPGEPGPAGASGSGLLLVDANGQTIGPYYPGSATTGMGRVLFHPASTGAETFVFVRVSTTFPSSTVAGPGGPRLLYTEPGCAGTAYLLPDSFPPTFDGPAISGFPGFPPGLMAVYPKSPYQPVAFLSQFAPPQPVGGQYACTSVSFSATAGEVGVIPLGGFVPNFTLVMP